MTILHLLLDGLSWLFLLGGSFFCLTGAVGLLRMPDFFTRVHGAGVIDGLGCGMILLGLIFQAPTLLIAIKLILMFLFLIVTGPTAVHALAQAALHGGVKLLPDTSRADHLQHEARAEASETESPA